MTTDFTEKFLQESPSRTRERVFESLLAIKVARGSAHGLDFDVIHNTLTNKLGYLCGSDGDGRAQHYFLKDKKGVLLRLDLYPTRKYDSDGNEGEKFVMMEYKGSSAAGYLNLNELDDWLERLGRDVTSKKAEDNVA